MRVTNEQALEIRDGFFQSIIVISRGYDKDGNENIITAGDVASDLLESRAKNAELLAALKSIEASSTGWEFGTAHASLDAEKVEYCEWKKTDTGYNSPPERPRNYFSETFLFCPYCGKPIRIKESE